MDKYAKYCCERPEASYSDEYVHALEHMVRAVLMGLECIYKDECQSSKTMEMVKHQIETLKGNNQFISKIPPLN